MIQNRSFKNKKGFTIVELMISIAIIALISTVVLFNHSKFSSDVDITNLAYRLALIIRQAQVYSISVKQFQTGGFNTPYGIHINTAAPTQMIFFGDEGDGLGGSSDGKYNSSDGSDISCNGSECVQLVSISRGNRIKKICGLSGFTDVTCQGSSLPILDIVFRRPNPDAILRSYSDYLGDPAMPCDPTSNNGNCNGWAICLISPQLREKKIVVYSTGQISVENVVSGDQNDACASQ